MQLREALHGRAGLLFVNFHHVRPGPDPQFPDLHHRTLEQFRTQLAELARVFEIVSPRTASSWMHATTAPSTDCCVLTFDDGLRDHYEMVAPILSEMKVAALFFVNTGPWEDGRLLSVHMAHLLAARYPLVELRDDFERSARAHGIRGAIADVDPRSALRQYRYDSPETAQVKWFLNAVVPQELRATVISEVLALRVGDQAELAARHYMTPAMVAALAHAGHEIGLHSHRHLHLASTTAPARDADLRANRNYLQQLALDGRAIRWISYPYGGPGSYDDAVVSSGQALGCSFGLTCSRGINVHADLDRMRLRRVDTNDVPGGKAPLSWEELSSSNVLY